MNAAAKKWVKALRSGKYQQTRHTLKDQDGYCCLGVGADLYRKAKKINCLKEFTKHESMLSPRIKEWLGLQTDHGAFCNDGHYGASSLIDMNDDNEKSFKDIATLIEREPEGLFVK